MTEPWNPDPFNQPIQPKRKRWPLVIAFIVAGVVVLCVFGIITSIFNSESSKPAVTTPVDAPTRAAAKVPVATKAPVVSEVGAGTYRVGKDIKSGTYRTPGAQKSTVTLCYWEVRTDGEPDGAIGAQGALNGENESGLVSLKKGQLFKTNGCKNWVRQ